MVDGRMRIAGSPGALINQFDSTANIDFTMLDPGQGESARAWCETHALVEQSDSRRGIVTVTTEDSDSFIRSLHSSDLHSKTCESERAASTMSTPRWSEGNEMTSSKTTSARPADAIRANFKELLRDSRSLISMSVFFVVTVLVLIALQAMINGGGSTPDCSSLTRSSRKSPISLTPRTGSRRATKLPVTPPLPMPSSHARDQEPATQSSSLPKIDQTGCASWRHLSLLEFPTPRSPWS